MIDVCLILYLYEGGEQISLCKECKLPVVSSLMTIYINDDFKMVNPSITCYPDDKQCELLVELYKDSKGMPISQKQIDRLIESGWRGC